LSRTWKVPRPLRRLVFSAPVRASLACLAGLRRRRLNGVLFVGVTGSGGKTTAKELITAVLSTRGAGTKTPATGNQTVPIARTILRTSSRDTFSVIELATEGPGTLSPLLRMVRPQIGVVISVGTDHFRAFRTREAVAAEKGMLVAALPNEGAAILNADDPHVLGMQRVARCPVITVGRNEAADVRAENVSSAWPERLSFDLLYRQERLRVQTRLCGEQWVHCALASIAVGLTAGIQLADAVRAVENVEPWPGRMSPLELGDGVTFIRDDYKAPYWSLPAALDFMRKARAERKIIVIGTISDYGGKASRKYVRVAKDALKIADRVVFVGPNARFCLRASDPARPDALRAFSNVREVAEHLRHALQPGDLVLLKGSNAADHLLRVVLARNQRVECWRVRCGKRIFCDSCHLLQVPESKDESYMRLASSHGWRA
jgi:UDP-N-acetylmuramoyl-tripeptide--D-alanyl-D-alanine ligase